MFKGTNINIITVLPLFGFSFPSIVLGMIKRGLDKHKNIIIRYILELAEFG